MMLLISFRSGHCFCILECASGSVVEHRLPKARAAGSNPVSRFFYFLKILVLQDLLFLCIKMKKQAPKNLPFMV